MKSCQLLKLGAPIQLVLALCTFLAACATGPRFQPTQPLSDMGVAYIYRPSQFLGAAAELVALVEKDRYELGNGTYVAAVIPPGQYYLAVGEGFLESPVSLRKVPLNADLRTLGTVKELKAGTELYIKINPAFSSKPDAAFVPAETARREIADCRLAVQ